MIEKGRLGLENVLEGVVMKGLEGEGEGEEMIRRRKVEGSVRR